MINQQPDRDTIKGRLKTLGWAKDFSAVVLPQMIYSEAFNSLSVYSLRVLIRLLQKRPFSKTGRNRKVVIHDGRNIPFSYNEAAAFGISTKSFRKSIIELIEKGFIEFAHQGSGMHKDFSTFNLLEDYLHWKPGTKIRVIEKSVPFSRGFTDYNLSRSAKSTVQKDCYQQSKMTVEGKISDLEGCPK